jgi:hypothetical protein
MMGIKDLLTKPRSIAPLAIMRIVFGAVLFISTLRFIIKGWVHDFYIAPRFHFPFDGFQWLHPMEGPGMYILYAVMALGALCICIGLCYRLAAPVFFCCFVYAELLDKTYYLNHYYLVTLISFLLILAPAHRRYSVDVLLRPSLHTELTPAWTILMFRWQLCIIYCCAGLSKLTADWLLHAEPLRIWLPAKASTPIFGPLLQQEWVAYCFSWAGALFDLCIPLILMNRRTRRIGYLVVVIFHALTAVLFQIGMFPYLMMAATLIFFFDKPATGALPATKFRVGWLLGAYFLWQMLMPFRFVLYPGNLLWTEEGYRFSWRVMLMEKGGTAFFYVKDPASGRKFEVDNRTFLTGYQERMMETQPDMILRYAHILEQYYRQRGIAHPAVTVQSYVTLNGSGSRLYIDSTINLATRQESWFGHKTWILPFKQ